MASAAFWFAKNARTIGQAYEIAKLGTKAAAAASAVYGTKKVYDYFDTDLRRKGDKHKLPADERNPKRRKTRHIHKARRTTSMPRNARISRRAPKRRKTYRSKRKLRRRLPRRSRRKTKKGYFSTKGFKIIDREKYAISTSTSAQTPVGHSSATTFGTKFLKPCITSSSTGWQTCKETATNHCQHVYGRLVCKLSDFMSGGVSSYFQKFKIKRITFTFKFPDQAADTSNSAHPLKMYVNYGDMYKAAWSGSIGYDTSQLNEPNELLERPGWKEYTIKRMNKLTISYVPTFCDTDEIRANTVIDQPRMKKSRYFDNHINSGLYLWGPTVCIRVPQPAGGYGTEVSSPAASAVLAESTFLDFTTCDVSAVIAFKDRNEDADN
jgi:hypothetical protein